MSLLRIRYQTIEFDDVDIHVRSLYDKMQFSDDDGIAEKLGISSATWPLFGIVWPSGKVLAHLMSDYIIEGKRILEIGCGLALASLVLNSRLADITATDYHPEVGNFLHENTQLNDDREIPFVRTGWDDEESQLGKFDLLIGSDLLYESDHAGLLSEFINQHAKQTCKIIIIDPGRGNQSRFSTKMKLLGYTHSKEKIKNQAPLNQPSKGNILYYNR